MKASQLTFLEFLIVVLTELGRSSQSFAELAGRTEGMMPDVVMALVEMGM